MADTVFVVPPGPLPRRTCLMLENMPIGACSRVQIMPKTLTGARVDLVVLDEGWVDEVLFFLREAPKGAEGEPS